MKPETKDAVLGNVATVIAFRCGADDAEVLERAFNHEYRAHQFTDLDRFEVYIKTTKFRSMASRTSNGTM